MTTIPSVPHVRQMPAAAQNRTPVKPILRKPPSVLGTRTRDDDDEQDNDDRLMSSPTKRRKTVAFNDSLNEIKEIGGKTLHDTKREVREALASHAAGDSEDYDRLKELFNVPRQNRGSDSDSDEDDEEEEDTTVTHKDLSLYVIALTSHVPLLGRSCSGLINAVLRYPWLGRDDLFARAYIQFMAALASAQGSCLALVLSSTIDRFKDTPSSWSLVGLPTVEKGVALQRLHTGFEYLLNLFPGALPITVRLIGEKFPFADDSKRAHMDYINNLVQITKYAPKMERDVMELILSKVCELDVGMALDLEDDDDTTRAVIAHLERAEITKELDEEDGDVSDADSNVSDESDDEDEETRRIFAISRKIQTLDAAICRLIEVYSEQFSRGPDSAEVTACFENLLSDFCNVILPNLKSRQYVPPSQEIQLEDRHLLILFAAFNFWYVPRETCTSPAVALTARVLAPS